jgi:hypothetical protein
MLDKPHDQMEFTRMLEGELRDVVNDAPVGK